MHEHEHRENQGCHPSANETVISRELGGAEASALRRLCADCPETALKRLALRLEKAARACVPLVVWKRQTRAAAIFRPALRPARSRRAVGEKVQERSAGDAPTRWRARLGQATASGRRRRGRRVSTSTSSSAPEHLTENGMPALGLITGAAALRLEQTVHSRGGGGRVRARAAGAHGSFSASRPLHRRS